MHKRIGIDIDNTITKIEPTLNELARYYGKLVPTVDMIKDYNISTVYGISEEESLDFWLTTERYIAETSEVSLERMRNMLSMFTDSDTEIYIITARSPLHYEATFNWLHEKGIHFDELIMTSGVSKVGVLREHEIELMIDDKPSLFYEAKESGIQTKMVCIDYPYNEGVPCYMRLSREGKVMENVH